MRKTGENVHAHKPTHTHKLQSMYIYVDISTKEIFLMIHNFLRLNQTYRQLLNDNEALTSDHKQLKSQLNEAKLEHTWLEADFSKLKKDYQQLDITCTKLTNQCEVCFQIL